MRASNRRPNHRLIRVPRSGWPRVNSGQTAREHSARGSSTWPSRACGERPLHPVPVKLNTPPLTSRSAIRSPSSGEKLRSCWHASRLAQQLLLIDTRLAIVPECAPQLRPKSFGPHADSCLPRPLQCGSIRPDALPSVAPKANLRS